MIQHHDVFTTKLILFTGTFINLSFPSLPTKTHVLLTLCNPRYDELKKQGNKVGIIA